MWLNFHARLETVLCLLGSKHLLYKKKKKNQNHALALLSLPIKKPPKQTDKKPHICHAALCTLSPPTKTFDSRFLTQKACQFVRFLLFNGFIVQCFKEDVQDKNVIAANRGGKCAVIILHTYIFMVYQIVVQQDARQHKVRHLKSRFRWANILNEFFFWFQAAVSIPLTSEQGGIDGNTLPYSRFRVAPPLPACNRADVSS